MKVIDSSGWLEYFTDGPLAEKYAPFLTDFSQVVTPVIVLYEVYKRTKRERSEEDALAAAAQLRKTQLIPLTEIVALKAADLSLQYGGGRSGLRPNGPGEWSPGLRPQADALGQGRRQGRAA